MGIFDFIGDFLGNRVNQAMTRRDIERLMDQQEESYQRNTFQDLYSPFGSSTWERTPDGRWIQNQAYSEEVQPIFDMALDRTMEGYGDVDPFQFRPGGLEELMNAQLARQGTRYGTDLRPEFRGRPGDGARERYRNDVGSAPPDAESPLTAPLGRRDSSHTRPPRLRE